MKLWIKTYVGDKITNSIVLSKKGVSRDVFDEMLKEANFTNNICVDKAKAFLKQLLDR